MAGTQRNGQITPPLRHCMNGVMAFLEKSFCHRMKGFFRRPFSDSAREGFLLFLLLTILPLNIDAKRKNNLSILNRVHIYATTLDTSRVATISYAYVRSTLRVERRNPILLTVPNAYVVARGKEREFTTEAYSKLTVKGYDRFDMQQLLHLTTIPHSRSTMQNFGKYLTPKIYDETIIGNTLLSPFHPNNFRFYKYHVDVVSENVVEMSFRPRLKSTQLLRGNATIDKLTGRIIKCTMFFEYDMISVWMSAVMGECGYASLFPSDCEGLFLFRFMGNRVSAHYKANFGLPQVLTEELENQLLGNKRDSSNVSTSDIPYIMSQARPDTLPALEQNVYRRKLTRDVEEKMRAASDSSRKKHRWAKDVLWDMVGDNVLNRIKQNFGQNNQGYVRVNPILNPLYMGYDHRRGFTYKFDVRGSYQLGDNSEINARLRAGYAFKLHQFYFRLPVYYYFNKHRNGYIKLEVGNGNRITSQSVLRDMKLQLPVFPVTPIMPDSSLFNEFKQGDMRLLFNYDLSSHWSFQVGALYQRKEAVHKQAFHDFGWQSVYTSFAPIFELQYRPIGWSGPVLTANYDRGIRHILGSNTDYERVELNAEYIHRINRLQSIQARLGSGLYTKKRHDAYFLNYENFKENNIPGGWNDDWSGEFELLRSDNYNVSNYYVRMNLTYESPLLFLSWLPYVGHYIEMERFYVSALEAQTSHPYLEFGYGFTTRLVSIGLFASNGKGNRSFGCKFGFELFRNW